MKKVKFLLIFALLLPLLVPGGPAAGEEGWCFEAYKQDPRSVFPLLASFSLELTARKNQGQISENEYDWAFAEMGAANEAFARGESALGCLKLEAVDSKFGLRPQQ